MKISVYKAGTFPVSSKKIKDIIAKTLKTNGIISDYIIDVAIVNDSKMTELVEKYMHEKNVPPHPVLSFPVSETEGEFNFPEGGVMELGDIVISYPQSVEIARKENKLIEEVVCDLAEHATLHLIGIHHD